MGDNDVVERFRRADSRGARLLAVAVSATFVVGTGVHWAMQDGVGIGLVSILLQQLDLGSENVIASWWAATLLMAVATTAALCVSKGHPARGGRAIAFGWLGIAAATALMSFDELGSMHERLGLAQRAILPSGMLRDTNLLIIAFVVAVSPAVMFIGLLRKTDRKAAALVTAAVGCFGLALFAENGGGRLWGEPAPSVTPRPLPGLLLEEGGELAGALCLLFAALHFIQRSVLRPVSPRTIQLLGLALPALLGLGMIFVLLIQVPTPAYPRLGDPIAWFPSMLALGSAVGALFVVRRTPARGVLSAFAVLAVVVALDTGAGEVLSEQFWPGSPRRRLAMGFAIGALAGAIALLTWRARLDPALQMSMILWAVAIPVGWVAAAPLRDVVLFTAHSAVVPALAYAFSAASTTATATVHPSPRSRRRALLQEVSATAGRGSRPGRR